MTTLLRPGERCWCVEPVTAAGVLVDCEAYYRELYRAASAARRSIFIAGWQFDSDVALLRGVDARYAERDVAFLGFLSGLCAEKPELEIRILAWDYSVVYALEREWFQRLRFDREAHERVIFRTDAFHPLGASHHQKFVAIDGELGFVGGADICAHRWDTPCHRLHEPDRRDGDEPYGPYHEVQAMVRGPIVARLEEIFRLRWRNAGHGEIPPRPPLPPVPVRARPSIVLPARRAALVRTQPEDASTGTTAVQETRELFRAAILSARRLVYLEVQYLSAAAVRDALIERMAEPGERPEIVLVLPSRAWAPIEALAVGGAQAEVLHALDRAAADTRTSLGVYYSVAGTRPGDEGPEEVTTFVHSKVLIVDDRFLCVASANATNRSMGLDTELSIAFEAGPGEAALRRAIRRVRVALLAEHTGLSGPTAVRRLARDRGLIPWLDTQASRLRRLPCHPPPLEGISFDPDHPLLG